MHSTSVRTDVLTAKKKRLKRKVRWRNRGGRRKKKEKEKKCSDTWEAVAVAVVSKGSNSNIAAKEAVSLQHHNDEVAKRQHHCSIAVANRQRGSILTAKQ
ncbi:hypothetical protein BHM03_00050900 [Ensete ventricosum]|nr:hypothetical protein BHM03_00050900 [Ensete ventricosum]